MNKKPALGRGLSALIETNEGGDVREIDVRSIEPNPHQPRKHFDQEKLEELAKSIKRHGVIQPIVVTQLGHEKYQIVVGERRLRAAKIAGISKLPAIIKKMNRKELMEAALIENIQRDDLNPVELAEMYKKLMAEFTYTQEDLSEVVGKSRSAVANCLRLLRLPDDIKDELRTGRITEGHGRALLAVESDKERHKLLKKILEEKATVRHVEKRTKSKLQRDVNITALEHRLTQKLKTRVTISGKNKKGKLIIEYYTLEQLDALIERLEGGHA